VVNPLAGATRIPLSTFTIWQAVGGLVWSLGLTVAGYLLGSKIPNIDRYLLPVIALIVAVSLIPIGIELLRRRGKEPDPKQRARVTDRS
jgi:membrane-associated protein